ncbi:SpiroCoCo family coiled-coil protein, partial [Sphaerochaeta sp.]|uniref:SpiroCoCo family coiled-coil protein n=1 Tax=Sphaerochaeta sp. TaxID=1972642 RepID=UPI003D0A1992
MGLELLLPVVLFLITLVIIYLLRAEDKKNHRLDFVKQRVQAIIKDVENTRAQFKDTAQQVEEKINHKIDASNQMLQRIDNQLAELEVRSEDLAKLQGVLNTYRDSLTKLGATTAQVEARIEQVKQESSRIEQIQGVIDGFDARLEKFHQSLQSMIDEAGDAIQKQQLRVKQLLDSSYAKLQEYESEVQEVERANQGRVASHAETLKSNEAASLAVLSGQLAKIRMLGDESEQIISLNKQTLEEQRELSFQDINEQKNQYELLKQDIEKTFADQQQQLGSLSQTVQDQALEAFKLFSQQCSVEMDSLFGHTISKTDLAFQTMVRTVTSFMHELGLRMEQAQQVSNELMGREHANLQSYADEIQSLTQRHADAVEVLRKGERKQEELQQVIAHLKQEADLLHTELSRLAKEKGELEVHNE